MFVLYVSVLHTFFHSAVFHSSLHFSDSLPLLFFSLKVADRFLRVRGSKQKVQIPRRGQNLSAETLKVPPLGDDFRRADAANAADGEWQEALCENLGLWDTSGLALGEHFSLTVPGSDCHGETRGRFANPLSCAAETESVSEAEQYVIRYKSIDCPAVERRH